MTVESDLTVTDARFDVLPGGGPSDVRVRVLVTGTGMEARAVPLMAWVGDAQVKSVSSRADGTGFTGHLDTVPPSGAKLTVARADEDPVETDIAFDGEPNA